MSNKAINHAFFRKHPTSSHKLVCLAIADSVADKTSETNWLSIGILARKCDLGKAYVKTILQWLEANGEIEWRRGRAEMRSTFRYLYKMEALDFGEKAGEKAGRGSAATLPGYLGDTLPGVSGDPHSPSAPPVPEKRVAHARNGEKPEQSRMTLLSVEDGEGRSRPNWDELEERRREEEQAQRVRAQIEEARRARRMGS